MSARFNSAWRSMPGSALISGRSRGHSDLHDHVMRSASGAIVVAMSLSTADELQRLQLQFVGPRELEESVDDLIEPLDLAADHVDVLGRRRGCALPPDRAHRDELPRRTSSFCLSSSR